MQDPEITVYLIVQHGQRDLEDCDWYKLTDKDKDEALEKVNGRSATTGD